ncbi:MAG: hypothetical protein ABSF54_07035 [Bryobacteraceae bacterium]
MHRKIVIIAAAGLMFASLAAGQSPVQPANALADSLARRLSDDLHVKTVVGEPIKVGAITLIPIMMMDVSFGGGGLAAPGAPAAAASPNPTPHVDGFFMSGEALPLGFVVIGKKGTRFISLAKPAAK